MSTNYRRIDTTDPRRHDRVKPMTLPAAWNDDSLDAYGMILTSSTMISGAAMITRMTPLAFSSLLLSLASYAHEKPLQKTRDSAKSQTGPRMGIAFSFMSVLIITFQRMLGANTLGQSFVSKQQAAKSGSS